MSLTEIKRDHELGQVSKLVNPGYKGPAVVSSFGQPTTSSSSLYSHTKSSQLKRGGTTVAPSNPIGGSVQVQPQLQSQLSNPPPEKKESKQNKSGAGANNVKQKVSPHRPTNKKNEPSVGQPKKQGVVILDQNKNQKGNQSNINGKNSKPMGGFAQVVQNNINLYNYNYNHQVQSCLQYENSNSDEIMGADDVSSIYPLET